MAIKINSCAVIDDSRQLSNITNYNSTSTNMFAGIGAGACNDTGNNNNFFGYFAGLCNTTGNHNNFFGRYAGRFNTTGSNNSFFGQYAGYCNTTGSDNILSGNSAGSIITTGSNLIVIGANAQPSSATAINEITLGNTNNISTRLRGLVQAGSGIIESATVSATAATGTINFDTLTQSVLFYTTNASANFTVNIRGSSLVTLDSLLINNQSITIAFLNTNGATAYYQTGFQIDGSVVTPKWQGGTVPSSGNINSVDVYVYSIIKTASATYTVLASQTKFA